MMPSSILGLIKSSIRQSLFYNAWYILGVTIIPALLGFIFWKLCSFYFPPNEVGIGAAILSAAGIIVGLANMGINIGIVRFLPSAQNPHLLHNTALSVNIIAALGFTVIFLAGVSIWSPDLVPYLQKPLYMASFGIYILVSAVGTNLRGVFIARRKSNLAFAYTAIANIICLISLIALLAHHPLAIIASNTIGYGIAMLISWFIFRSRAGTDFRYLFKVDWDILKKLIPYSFSSHIANFLFWSFQSIFPLIVLNFLGSDSSGQIYVVLMIFGAAVSPGLSLGYSALSESVNDMANRQTYHRKAMLIGVGLALILSIILVVTARWILLLFGVNYPLEGTGALQWLAVAVPFVVINQIYSHMLRGFDLSKELVWMNLIIFILSVAITIYLIPMMGISAVSIGLFSSNLFVFLIWCRKIIRLVFGINNYGTTSR
jgi:O-antigen/teichoic acid export membrane protein